MTKDCSNCHLGNIPEYIESCWSSGCVESPDHQNWQPMTNADKVRNMTDKELLEVLKQFNRIDGKLSDEDVIEWMERVDDEP